MQAKNKNPQEIAAEVADLEEILLGLPGEQKAALQHCIDTGEKAPATLAGLLEAVKAALEIESESERIKAAIAAPRVLTYHPNEAPASEKEVAEFAEMQLTIFSMLGKEPKARVAEAIRQPDKREALPLADRYIYGTLCAILTFPGDFSERISRIFNVTAGEIAELQQTARESEAITIPADDSEQYLPGFNPPSHREPFSNLIAPPSFNPQKFIMRETSVIPTSKLAQLAAVISADGETTYIDIAPAKRNKPATTITVALELPEEISTTQKLTYYDLMVEAAIGNILEDNPEQPIFTARMVYRRMRGLTSYKINPKPSAIAKVEESINKLSFTKAEIDYTEQMKLNPNNAPGKYSTEKIILHATKYKYTPPRGGASYTIWSADSLPVIYKYSKDVNQISTIKTTLLGSSNTNATPETMTAQFYLIQQIERMKSKQKRRKPYNNKITYDKLFERTGDTLPLEKTPGGRKARFMRLDHIKKTLDNFIAEKYIAGYTEEIQGKKKHAVIISLPA